MKAIGTNKSLRVNQFFMLSDFVLTRFNCIWMCVCVCVCCVCVCACMCVCMCVRACMCVKVHSSEALMCVKILQIIY